LLTVFPACGWDWERWNVLRGEDSYWRERKFLSIATDCQDYF
jgi:hypothetical protein